MNFATPKLPDDVAHTYAGFLPKAQAQILTIRTWIFEEVARDKRVGKIHEALKWGQPSFVVSKPRSGTTLRLAQTLKSPKYDFGLFVPCQTNLIDTCRDRFGDVFNFDGNRGLLFENDHELPETELRHFIALALTYYVK